jgi:DNA polymerase III epsilon subunit-like protein
MKYVSIDIETTGLDREKCEILSIGAVIEDTSNPLPIDELPKYHVAIKRNGFYGEPTALTMNAGLIGAITEYQNSRNEEDRERIAKEYDIRFLDESEVAVDFYHWLFANSAFEYDPQRVLSGHVTRHPLFGMVPVVGSSVQKAHINVAGKNFATFDKVFLERLPRLERR